MKNLRNLSTALALALTIGSAAACDSEVCSAGDTDGDGLSNCEEYDLGTAQHLADTDGDGLTDFEEVVELGFSPDNNNYKFNPRIADTPKVRVDITSAPKLALLYTSSTGQEISHGVERSTNSAATTTQGSSDSNSQAVEHSETVGASLTVGTEVSFPGGASASAEATASYESSVATTRESSHSWSREQSQENSNGMAEATTAATSAGSEIHGGSLSVTVDVVNEGDVAYTLSNVALSAYMTTPGRQQKVSPVGGLSFDTALDFPEFTYAPGQHNGPFIFANKNLDTATAEALVGDSTNLNLRVVAYELTDEDGRSFTHDQTEIFARTATIIVDYNVVDGGPNTLTSERYQVATNTDPSRLRISATDALADTLSIPFTVDADGSLVSVRELENNTETQGHWVVVHKSTDGVLDTIAKYSESEGAYDFASLELKSGDVMHLIYIEDIDGDGLGTRMEAAYGTDVEDPDSDNDGLLDGEEVNDYQSSPLRPDTDGDRLTDFDEVKRWNSSPLHVDSDEDGITDDLDMFSVFSVGNEITAVTASGELWQWGDTARILDNESEWTELYTGENYFFARSSDGAYVGSGTNAVGQLGESGPVEVNGLVPVLGMLDFTTISSGWDHSVAIAVDGTLWTWGSGQGLAMVSGESWLAVSAGDNSSFAIKNDGTLWSWGQNRNGILGHGDGAPAQRTFPTQVGLDSDWAGIEASAVHVVAIKESGTLWSWGMAGLLGIDSSIDLSSPVQVGSDSDWATVSTSWSHTLGIKTNGTLWAWGEGYNGALGLGDERPQRTPSQVGIETHWVGAQAYASMSAALSTDNSLWTWGFGALGHPSGPECLECSVTPAQVRLSE